jgi:lactate dehydrogenase-like 2-hydroxyacid dehydrogenase
MCIVLLDRSTLGDGDLSELTSCGEVVSYPTTSPTQVVERCRGAEIVISNKVVVGEPELDELPDLRLMQVAATGVNNIDRSYAVDSNTVL